MEKVIRNGEVIGYVMVGFIVFSFWGYYLVRNTNLLKLLGKIKGGKMKW